MLTAIRGHHLYEQEICYVQFRFKLGNPVNISIVSCLKLDSFTDVFKSNLQHSTNIQWGHDDWQDTVFNWHHFLLQICLNSVYLDYLSLQSTMSRFYKIYHLIRTTKLLQNYTETMSLDGVKTVGEINKIRTKSILCFRHLSCTWQWLNIHYITSLASHRESDSKSGDTSSLILLSSKQAMIFPVINSRDIYLDSFHSPYNLFS